MKKVIDSFVSLGLDDGDLNKVSLVIYREYLEIPFLKATEKYYEQESEAFLAENSVSDYLEDIEARLREEEDRIDRYLNPVTRKELISKCEVILIGRRPELMWESFQDQLVYDKGEELQRMYTLFSRIADGLEPLGKMFEEHVKKTGLNAISKLVGGGTEGELDALDPKVYVRILLDIYGKNFETAMRRFRGDADFVAGLEKACRDFFNRNAATSISTTKSAELLARCVDVLLGKNNKEDCEGTIDRVVGSPDSRVHTSTHALALDDTIPVHGRQRRIPGVLYNEAGDALHPRIIEFRRRGDQYAL